MPEPPRVEEVEEVILDRCLFDWNADTINGDVGTAEFRQYELPDLAREFAETLVDSLDDIGLRTARDKLLAVLEHRDEGFYQRMVNSTNIGWRWREDTALTFEQLLITVVKLLDINLAETS